MARRRGRVLGSLLAIGLLTLTAVYSYRQATGSPGSDAGVVNLQNVNTTAQAFYEAHGTFVGFYEPNRNTSTPNPYAGVTLSEAGSTRPALVSIANGDAWLVLTAFTVRNHGLDDPAHRCWVLVDLEADTFARVVGETRTGVYYGVLNDNAGGRACRASRELHVPLDISGFPGYPLAS